MLIDVHTHIGTDFYNQFYSTSPLGQDPEILSATIRKAGVELAVIFPQPFTLYYDPRTSNQHAMTRTGLLDYPYEVENRYVEKAGVRFREFIPFACIDPKSEQLFSHINESIQVGKIRGLKFHPLATHSYVKDLLFSPYMTLLEETGLPILIHSGNDKYSSPHDIVKIASEFPSVRICAAHLGGFSKAFLMQVEKHNNLYVDTSPFVAMCKSALGTFGSVVQDDLVELPYSLPEGTLEELCRMIPRSLLWGTDEPWTMRGAVDYHFEVSILTSLKESSQYAIAEQNTCRFLGIDAK